MTPERSLPTPPGPLRRTAWALLALALGGAAAQSAPPAPPVQAAPAPAPQAPAFTLADALAGVRNAPGWRSADLAYRAAQQALDAARARAGLSVAATADYSLSRVPTDQPFQGGGNAGLNASLNVLPWTTANDPIRSAGRALERAAFDLRDARNTLALSVTQQYFAARNAGLDLELATAQLTAANRLLEVTRAQQAAGQATAESVLDRQKDQQTAQASLEGARLTLELNLRQLGNTLGRDLGGVSLTTAPTLPGPPAPLDGLIARAQAARGEVRKAASSLDDARAGLDSARRDRSFPDLSLTARYGQLGSAQGSGALLSAGLNVKTGAATLGVSTPLSGSSLPSGLSLGVSGGFNLLSPAEDAAIRSAETGVQSAQLSLDTARTSVDLDVRQKYVALQNALGGLTAARTGVTRAETALRTAQAREAAGLGTALDTQSAQLALGQAQRAVDTAVSAAYQASLTLANATVDFDPSLLAAPAGAANPDPSTSAQPSPVQPGGQP